VVLYLLDLARRTLPSDQPRSRQGTVSPRAGPPWQAHRLVRDGLVVSPRLHLAHKRHERRREMYVMPTPSTDPAKARARREAAIVIAGVIVAYFLFVGASSLFDWMGW
jgi:hypothetical protein